jgi:hypothetical protein
LKNQNFLIGCWCESTPSVTPTELAMTNLFLSDSPALQGMYKFKLKGWTMISALRIVLALVFV